jgi:hypothetical protein
MFILHIKVPRQQDGLVFKRRNERTEKCQYVAPKRLYPINQRRNVLFQKDGNLSVRRPETSLSD